MPTLAEALRFTGDPKTTDAQLRRACEILLLDASGSGDATRVWLLAYLEGLDDDRAVVCLNPRLTEADS